MVRPEKNPFFEPLMPSSRQETPPLGYPPGQAGMKVRSIRKETPCRTGKSPFLVVFSEFYEWKMPIWYPAIQKRHFTFIKTF
jgi:hypothetical protein